MLSGRLDHRLTPGPRAHAHDPAERAAEGGFALVTDRLGHLDQGLLGCTQPIGGQLHAQALGIGVPSQLLSALPYLATIAVLVLISRNKRLTMINTPASLGKPFVPDR